MVSPTDQADPVSRFWRHERLHRRALADFPEAMGLIAPERDALEADFVQRIEAVETAEPEARRAVMAACWREADAAETRWADALAATLRRPRAGGAQRSWARLNRAAGIRV